MKRKHGLRNPLAGSESIVMSLFGPSVSDTADAYISQAQAQAKPARTKKRNRQRAAPKKETTELPSRFEGLLFEGES